MVRLFYICSIFLLLQTTLANDDETSAEQSTPAAFDNLLHMAQVAIENCYEDNENTKQIQITDDGLFALLQGSRDPPRNTKCLRYCIMRRNKLFDEQNSLNTKEMLTFFAKLYNNDIEENMLKEVLQKCNEATANQADRCERAHQSSMCIITKLNESGVTTV